MTTNSWGRTLSDRFPSRDPVIMDREWAALKEGLRLGDSVTGTVLAKAPFGAWIDIGVGFPALLELPQIAGLTPAKYRADEWCAIGSEVNASVVAFQDDNKQVYLSQVNLQKLHK